MILDRKQISWKRAHFLRSFISVCVVSRGALCERGSVSLGASSSSSSSFKANTNGLREEAEEEFC